VEKTLLTEKGKRFFKGIGFDFDAPQPVKRKLCKFCLDYLSDAALRDLESNKSTENLLYQQIR